MNKIGFACHILNKIDKKNMFPLKTIYMTGFKNLTQAEQDKKLEEVVIHNLKMVYYMILN